MKLREEQTDTAESKRSRLTEKRFLNVVKRFSEESPQEFMTLKPQEGKSLQDCAFLHIQNISTRAD